MHKKLLLVIGLLLFDVVMEAAPWPKSLGKILSWSVLAQSPTSGTASISGDLKGATGEPVSGVAVRVTNLNRGIAVTKTGNRGQYQITGLLSGIYEVVTRREGYEPAVAKQVVLQSGEHKVVHLTLKPGNDNELKELLATVSDRAALMPEGAGRNIIIGGCVGGCHDLTEVLSGRKAKEEWNTTIDRMLKLAWRSTRRSATIRQGKEVMADYLAKHYGPNSPPMDFSKIKSVPYSPDARVIFTQFSIPNLRGREAHPHDPIVDSQGNVWYTGTYDDTIGKFDPRDATFTRYSVPTPDSHPHGITVDKQDHIWFTLETKDKIAKLDPKSGAITEYTVPSPDPRSHSLIFDSRGVLWITAMEKIIRFDPKTEKFLLYTVPWSPSRPYGLLPDSKGMIWFTDFHTSDRIGRLDPQTGKFTGYDPPTKSGGRRRIAIDSKDNIWFTQYYAHKIGRVDAKTFAITEYDTPSPASSPYAITVDKGDIVWFTEHGSNRLAKFDPQTKRFTEYLMPSPRALVRKVAWDPQGRLWMAESEIDKITMVEEY
jgi:virginiamycin B lyase